MQIQVGSGPDDISLAEPGVFTAFSVGFATTAEKAQQALTEVGARTDVDEHIWVPAELVRRLAGSTGAPADAEWDQSFAAMIDYARSRGWYDETTATIRAHLEPL
jgi:hypothetical protein